MLRDRRKLSPVLSDEPLVGQGIKRRVRVVLVTVVAAIVLTNATSYLIGQKASQTARADAGRDTRARIARLERDFAADLDERRRQRDAEVAGQDAKLAQLRRDVCTLADRVQPRDDEVQQMRRHYGCTSGPEPATSSSTGGGGSAATGPPPAAPRPAPAPRPGPAAPSAAPAPTGTAGAPVCVPLFGCVL